MASNVDRGANQKRRTRKAILKAAARLIEARGKPTLEEIAEEAMVSRATAYRYFPGLDALLLEALVDMEVPAPDELFGNEMPEDLAQRLETVDRVLHEMFLAKERQLRLMLSQSVQREATGSKEREVPIRQNRRTPLIEAALKPFRKDLGRAQCEKLSQAAAFLIGPEGVIVSKDVLQISDAEALEVKRWAFNALVEAAKRGE